VDTGPEGVWAESVVAGGELTCPELALAEASNILRRLELAGDLSRREATAAHENLMRLDLGLFPFAPFAGRIWDLRMNLTCYDAWYVALAEALGRPLATLDERLGRASGPRCEIITPPGE
jgi:predicted nucleic acid-binding protein